MKIALGSRSSSCIQVMLRFSILCYPVLGKTVNIRVNLEVGCLGTWGLELTTPNPGSKNTPQAGPNMPRAWSTLKLKEGTCIKMQQKTIDFEVLEIALSLAWYRNANTGNNAEHRMSPYPPKYTNKNVNKVPMQMQHTHCLVPRLPAMCEKNIFCIFHFLGSQNHTFHQEVFMGKSQMKTLPHWLSNRRGLRFEIFQ